MSGFLVLVGFWLERFWLVVPGFSRVEVLVTLGFLALSALSQALWGPSPVGEMREQATGPLISFPQLSRSKGILPSDPDSYSD